MGELFRRIYYLLNRRRLERELQNDIDVHREMLSPEARKDFGNAALARERSREAWGWGWLDRLAQDLRFGARVLKKSPGLAFTAIIVLALGIGVNVTVFNLVNAFFLRPLPVHDPFSLVRFTSEAQEYASTEVAYPAAMFYGQHSQALSAVITQRWSNMTFGQHTSENVRTGLVSANYFHELGITAAYGRLFSPQVDGAANAAPVAVLGYGFWQRRFGGDAAIVGKTISLNQHPATVIGVAPYDFTSLDTDEGEHDDVWLLAKQETYFVPQSRVLTSFNADDSRVHMWGRLKPGVSMKAAEQSLLPLAQQLAHDHPDVLQKDEHLKAAPGGYAGQLDADVLPLFAMLAALMLLILATACGNLGNLLLGRAATREREIATRLALGATRSRIVRQLLTENFMLAAAGSAVALFLSWMVSRAIVVTLGAPANFDYSPDWRTVTFAFGAGVFACLLAGLAPARRLAKLKLRGSRLRTIFMATQVMASCVLLVVSSLLVRAMERAFNRDPGFDYTHTLTVDPSLYAHGYEPAAAADYFDKLEARIAQAPGVESVSLTICPPMGNRARMQRAHGALKFDVYFNEVKPEFFRTMAIPVLRGRDFSAKDHDVVIVSDSYARGVWPGKDPLQQTYESGGQKLPVIGVVGNARAVEMRNGNAAEMYMPMKDKSLTEAVALVRTSGHVENVAAIVGDVARGIDPVISPEVHLVKNAFAEKVGVGGKIALVISATGIMALLLAIIGLYGVVAFNVSQRTREIGIRMALGASSSKVIRSVVSQFLWPLTLAMASGLALAAAISLALRTMLYGLNNFDPLSYLCAFILLSVVGGFAALLPARRALRVDPMDALRCE
ncbi:MAG TPA: ABC transporter permease [Candidatus Angelobacter sp.]|nr:ABC transporter permease [Candidatus Angelobacter sp.]